MVGVFYCLAVNRKRQWPLTKTKFNVQKQYVVPRETVCTLNLRIPVVPWSSGKYILNLFWI
jgi:hypothetical protein